MISRLSSRALRSACLLAALWSCAPAMASVGAEGALVQVAEALARRGDLPADLQPAVMPAPVLMAAADCSGAAAQAAADSGGQVLSVSSRQKDGKTVCVVTVLVPGSDGGRPRKQTITIEQ